MQCKEVISYKAIRNSEHRLCQVLLSIFQITVAIVPQHKATHDELVQYHYIFIPQEDLLMHSRSSQDGR